MSKTVIYGSGNMAWALCHALRNKVSKLYISGRSVNAVSEISQKLNVPFLTSIENETESGDTIILAVKDDALHILNQELKLPGRFVCHTAGSVSSIDIKDISENTGVFYPLQRVTKYTSADFSHSPICIESESNLFLNKLNHLGTQLSDNVIVMNSEKRRMAHLAAIFVSNFPNFMMMLGKEILLDNDLPENLLDELAKNTFDGCLPSNAKEKQTGPARRADLKVIGNHLHLLEKNASLEPIYRLLSFEIMRRFHTDK